MKQFTSVIVGGCAVLAMVFSPTKNAYAQQATPRLVQLSSECDVAITEQATRQMYNLLLSANRTDGCVFDGLSSQRNYFVATFHKGQNVQAIAEIVPSQCIRNTSDHTAGWTPYGSPELHQHCPTIAASLQARVGEFTQRPSTELQQHALARKL